MKRFIISVILLLVLAGPFGIYGALKYRQSLRQVRQIAKAPDVSVTFVEGWDNRQMGGYLEKNSITKATDFLQTQKTFDFSNYPLLSGKPAKSDLEGFLFPDTYFIPRNPPAGSDINKIIITKALDNFSQKITNDIVAQARTQGLNVYQLITLASIVEKETGASQDDKRMVAGVFYNRLNAGMPLESDATVSFATGNPVVSTNDIQIDSPYNTYKYKGLPFGPICNPGLNSILAAANPKQSDYLFFLTDPKTGNAIFAKTYQEHLANKQKYLK